MAGARRPGPAGFHPHPQSSGYRRAEFAPGRPGPNAERNLSPEEQGLLLDVVQLTLDIVGIIEPTPFADGSNAVISLARRDWFGFSISVVSMVPYLGDFAKIGKLPKYARSIREAIAIAREDSRFAKLLEPGLRKLARLIDDLPMSSLPHQVEPYFRQIRGEIEGFLHLGKAADGALAKAMDRLPAEIRSSFEQAMHLPREANPRLLSKHAGPVAEDALVKELEKKGFVRVKSGSHPNASGAAARGEDSDIWLRRVTEEGKDSFEAIRVDRKAAQPAERGGKRVEAAVRDGNTGGVAKPFSREHHGLSETTQSPAPGSGIQVDPKALGDHLGRGGYKSDFSHWHHEQIEATPENLSYYLQPNRKEFVPSIRKFDPVGVELTGPKYGKGSP